MRLLRPEHGCFPLAPTQIAAIVKRAICHPHNMYISSDSDPHSLWESKENSQDSKVTGRERDQKSKNIVLRYTVHHCAFFGNKAFLLSSFKHLRHSLPEFFCQRHLHISNQRTKHISTFRQLGFAQQIQDLHQNK